MATETDNVAGSKNSILGTLCELKPKKETVKEYLIVGAAYLIIALFVFSSLATNMSGRAPGVGSDTYENLWSMWWVGYATLHLHTSIWTTFRCLICRQRR